MPRKVVGACHARVTSLEKVSWTYIVQIWLVVNAIGMCTRVEQQRCFRKSAHSAMDCFTY